MTDPTTFRADTPFNPLPKDAQGNFPLPPCLRHPELMAGEDLPVLVVTTVEGQRVGVPMGVNALEHLRGIAEAGLRIVPTAQ